ncbi:MAG: hypothetical protein J3K34DRAFT_418909 [Monoraphidium minutum]|nr:MAG: hypothetical protein J3K34DRAFT_418909 [Monoraphidium minutum]
MCHQSTSFRAWSEWTWPSRQRTRRAPTMLRSGSCCCTRSASSSSPAAPRPLRCRPADTISSATPSPASRCRSRGARRMTCWRSSRICCCRRRTRLRGCSCASLTARATCTSRCRRWSTSRTTRRCTRLLRTSDRSTSTSCCAARPRSPAAAACC